MIDKETILLYKTWLLSLINHALIQMGFRPITSKVKRIQNSTLDHLDKKYLLIRNQNSQSEYNKYLSLGIKPLHISPSEFDSLDKNQIYLVLGQYDNNIQHIQHLRHQNIRAIWDQTLMESDNHKPIWKRRVSVVEAIYSDLMTERLDNRDSVVLTEKVEWIDFEHGIFNKYLEKKEIYKESIQMLLKGGWDLSRMNPITSSILLESLAEYDALKTDPIVLITQSVKTAKNYCGEEDYKIINGILDNYFKSLDQ